MKLKRFQIICLFIFLLPGTGIAMDTGITAQSGLYYDSWQDNDGNSGWQWYAPLEVTGRFDAFTVRILSAYISSGISSDAADSQSLSTLLDTKLNLSYELVRVLPVNLLFGLDLNLPTGRTNLDDNQLTLIMDPDLVPITHFGEGFNINPTITAAKTWRDWQAGMSLGYAWRGEYHFSATTQNYDPGDIINISVETRYTLSPMWQLRGFAGYAWYGTDQVQGTDFYQEGAYLMVGGGAKYLRKTWRVDASLAGIIRGESQFNTGAGALQTEDKNSQGNEVVINLGGSYDLSTKITLKSRAEYLMVADNGFDRTSAYHMGSRQKFSLLVGMTYAFYRNFRAELNLKGFTMHEDDSWTHPGEERSYQGGSVAAYITYGFK